MVASAHGDVVYWPLLALGQYLAATGDTDLLREEVAFTGDGRPGAVAPLVEHVERALSAVEASFVPGLALPAYGHGDWNDSLQPADPALARRMVSTWTVVLQAEALDRLADGVRPALPSLAERAADLAARGTADLRRHLLVDGVLCGYGVVGDDGTVTPMIHPRDSRTGLRYSLLPMIHAVAGDLLSPGEAAAHLRLVDEHLTGPDGARLFDRPVAYRGGPTEIFQRAEASSFFGREIGIMYVHAHLRHAEALARVGDGPGLLRALARAVPVGLSELVPSAAPRQANTYSSSSDGAFADRYEASRDYDRALAGEVPLEAGWRSTPAVRGSSSRSSRSVSSACGTWASCSSSTRCSTPRRAWCAPPCPPSSARSGCGWRRGPSGTGWSRSGREGRTWPCRASTTPTAGPGSPCASRTWRPW
ncbi:hypothetical protein [Ornithinimicrobium humiphilum]|uniref:hypothetical protein n=1 Tax=Ornithinimicrobium humiphilum TaxID=125288 RepID=UPI00115116BE|nr:hypothetical protein [Ornithinimicrobium humiphilum]